MEQGIKFVITGDTSGLESASKIAKRRIEDVNKSLQKNAIQAQKNARQIELLNRLYSEGKIPIDRYKRGLEQITLQEDRQQTETIQLRKDLSNLNREYRELGNKSLKGANTSIPKYSKNLDIASKSQRNASLGAVEFGRLLGDLPYGIQGVANNIQQLAFVMGGGAALQLGIAGVTALMVVFKDDVDALVKSLFGAKEGFEELAKSISDSTANAKSEVAVLQSLISIANDDNKSRAVRQKAIDTLNETYGEYLGNLDLETIGYEESKKAIDQVNASLLRKAKIEGLSNRISEIVGENENEIVELSLKRRDAYKDVRSELSKLQKSSSFFRNIIDDSAGVNENIENIIKATGSLDNAQLRLLKNAVLSYKSLDSELKGVEKSTNEAIKPLLEVQTILQATDFESELEITGVVVTPEMQKDRDSGEGTARGKQYAKNFNEGLTSVGLQPLQEFSGELLSDPSQLPTEGIDEYIAKMQQAQEVSGIFASATSSALGALGNEIAGFFETGNSVIDAFVGSIINSLAQIAASFLSNLITQKIIAQKTILTEQAKSNANAITIASSAAAALGPFGAAALPALIATQLGVINGAFAGIQAMGAFAQGGAIGGGSFTGDKVPILANSGEYVLTAQDQGYLTNFLRGNTGGTTNTGGAIRVTGRIEAEGGKLVTVISESQTRNKRLGGSRKL